MAPRVAAGLIGQAMSGQSASIEAAARACDSTALTFQFPILLRLLRSQQQQRAGSAIDAEQAPSPSSLGTTKSPPLVNPQIRRIFL